LDTPGHHILESLEGDRLGMVWQSLDDLQKAAVAEVVHSIDTRKHCMRAGERHLVVPAASEAAFRLALREIGYLLAPALSPPTIWSNSYGCRRPL
jgi:hypothetical protein